MGARVWSTHPNKLLKKQFMRSEARFETEKFRNAGDCRDKYLFLNENRVSKTSHSCDGVIDGDLTL